MCKKIMLVAICIIGTLVGGGRVWGWTTLPTTGHEIRLVGPMIIGGFIPGQLWNLELSHGSGFRHVIKNVETYHDVVPDNNELRIQFRGGFKGKIDSFRMTLIRLGYPPPQYDTPETILICEDGKFAYDETYLHVVPLHGTDEGVWLVTCNAVPPRTSAPKM